MKRFLFYLVALVITNMCFAQDIIVKKDGKTIQAKIIEVSPYEVKYMLYKSTNETLFCINTTELLSINYENGTKDVFENKTNGMLNNVEASVFPEHNGAESMHGYVLSNQIQAESLYKKSNAMKTLAIVSAVLGGICIVTSTTSIIINSQDDGVVELFPGHYTFYGLGAAGIIGYIALNNQSKKLQHKAQGLLSTSVFQTEYKCGNFAMCPSIDIYKDIYSSQLKPFGAGVGVKLIF